jgi:hypothetical protein
LFQKEKDLITRVNELDTLLKTQKETINMLQIDFNTTKRTYDVDAEELRETKYKRQSVKYEIDEIVLNMSL